MSVRRSVAHPAFISRLARSVSRDGVLVLMGSAGRSPQRPTYLIAYGIVGRPADSCRNERPTALGSQGLDGRVGCGGWLRVWSPTSSNRVVPFGLPRASLEPATGGGCSHP